MYHLLILQYTAHLLADFNFQPQKWCDAKDSKFISKEHIWHSLIVFVFSFLLSFQPSFWWGALIIAIFHLIIDMVKSIIYQKIKVSFIKQNLFFLDQTSHFLIITVIVFMYWKFDFIHFPFAISGQVLYFVFAIIACTKPMNLFIRKFIESNCILISDEKEDKSLLKAGRIIGSLERILSFVLITFNQFAAVGFLIAAKSILRFRDTETAKTEYLLIGSLLSFGSAIILGIIYQVLFSHYLS